MPIESATYLDGLNTANPLSTDGASQGDDHIRLIKTTLKNTFPGLTAPVNLVNTTVPIGMISLWFGSLVSIPTGWAQCNGASHTRTDGGGSITTPDLRGKTVFGTSASAPFTQGATGGAASVTSGSAGDHSHTVTVAAGGSHTHTATVAAGGAHTHTVTVAAGGSHTHTGSANAGGAHSHTLAAGGTHNHVAGSTAITTEQMPAHFHYVVAHESGTDSVAQSRAISDVKSDSGDSNYILTRTATQVYADTGRSSLEGGGLGHTHTIADAGSHTHTVGTSVTHTHTLDIGASATHTHTATTAASATHTHTATVDAAANHTHTATSASTGAHQHTVATMPPYMSLYYIMKI